MVLHYRNARAAVATAAFSAFSCIHGTSPAYFHDIFHPVASVEGRAMLRSANFGDLVEPRTRGRRYGPRSFHVTTLSVLATPMTCWADICLGFGAVRIGAVPFHGWRS